MTHSGLRRFARGEYAEARGLAETFLREAEAQRRATEAGAAHRMLGLILLHQGELKAARSVSNGRWPTDVPERDGETRFRFSEDTEVSAASFLALTELAFGRGHRFAPINRPGDPARGGVGPCCSSCSCALFEG